MIITTNGGFKNLLWTRRHGRFGLRHALDAHILLAVTFSVLKVAFVHPARCVYDYIDNWRTKFCLSSGNILIPMKWSL